MKILSFIIKHLHDCFLLTNSPGTLQYEIQGSIMFCKFLFKNRHQNTILFFKQCFYCNMHLNGVVKYQKISAVPNFVPETQNTQSKNIYLNPRFWLLNSLGKHKEFSWSFAICLSEIPLMNPLICHRTEGKPRGEKAGTRSWNVRHHGYEHSPFKSLR